MRIALIDREQLAGAAAERLQRNLAVLPGASADPRCTSVPLGMLRAALQAAAPLPSVLPRPPLLLLSQVVSNCEQHLTSRYTRRLITMQASGGSSSC